jgi:6,7-dimethyl-8-ribityllumazine synthase
MSGPGSPTLRYQSDPVDCSDLRVAVVASSWHDRVMSGLITGAERALADFSAGGEVVRVPGSFELPVVAGQLARTHDAVVALGVVIRGGTPHFDYVCRSATDGLTRVALDHGVAVGFGLLTCDDEAQAIARAGLDGSQEDKGYEATVAALLTARTLRDLRDQGNGPDTLSR